MKATNLHLDWRYTLSVTETRDRLHRLKLSDYGSEQDASNVVEMLLTLGDLRAIRDNLTEYLRSVE